ncbi:MAG: PEP-CTERM sorting domain-containing protein [Desulfobaccales bacterium]
MKRNKGIILGLVLALAICWGSWAQASQISFHYDIYCPDTGDWAGSVGPGLYRYFFDPVAGDLLYTPSVPGSFDKEITIPSSFTVYWDTRGTLANKGPDSVTVPLSYILANPIFNKCSLDQTGPLPFTDATWRIIVRQDDTFHGFLFAFADTDLLLHGGEFSPSGVYSFGTSIDIPVTWDDFSPFPDDFHLWRGNGSATIDFDLIVSVYGSTYVPVPGALLLFGSGLFGLAGWRFKFKRA